MKLDDDKFWVVTLAAMVMVLATLLAWVCEQKRELPIEHRRLVFECMGEIGWEMADLEAEPQTQVEQSRAWCEAFVRGVPTR